MISRRYMYNKVATTTPRTTENKVHQIAIFFALCTLVGRVDPILIVSPRLIPNGIMKERGTFGKAFVRVFRFGKLKNKKSIQNRMPLQIEKRDILTIW
mmetsp:Transcript_20434/g.38698  ORF Transcript_20434/g.38698 Transcript_20434/m.38698 type:complete len:98 (+) Transcript_20434:101-394(+)